VFWLWGTSEFYRAIEDLQRVEVPGSGTVTLDRGRYTIYHEYEDAGRCTPVGDGASSCSPCRIETVTVRPSASETQPDVVLLDDESGQSYSTDDLAEPRDGVACSTFSMDVPGEYTLSARGDAGTAAVGRDLADGRGRWDLRAHAGLIPAVGWGLAVLGRQIIQRRRRHRGADAEAVP